MKIFVCVVAALLATALAGPVREKRNDQSARELLESIKDLKNPETYSELNKASEYFKKLVHIGKSVERDELTPEEQKEMDENLKLLGRAQEGIKVLYELAKVTMVEGAKPTEQELTNLAKRLSAVVRQSRLSMRNYANADTLMTNETIDILKQIAEANVLRESENKFLDIFKEKLPKIYPGAHALKTMHTNLKTGMKTGNLMNTKKISEEEHQVLAELFGEFVLDELIAMLKSEEAAIEIFKNFGIIVDTLKTASSYDNLQTMYNSLARSKRLESYAILVSKAGKCFGKPLSAADKAQFHEHIGKFLQLFKLVFADGQDTSNIDELERECKQKIKPKLQQLMMKMAMVFKTPEGKQQLRACLLSEEDRKVFKETMALPDAVFSDNQINELRQKNEKIYAIVNLLNGVVNVVRKREGLGAEADSFLKEMVTMPNSMLRISEFLATQETLDKIAAHKKMVMDKYNGLSGTAKKEFVNMFPYRTVFNLALLE